MEDKKKIGLWAALGTVIAVLVGLVIYLFASKGEAVQQTEELTQQNQEYEQLLELAEMDKREMENSYEEFAMQYNEMRMQLNNDSLKAELEKEQKRAEEALAELRRTNSRDAQEIMRLKKELATLRNILKSYVNLVDSLNRENERLKVDNTNLRTRNEQAQQHINNLSTEKEELAGKVAIASQLNATGISAAGWNKKSKPAKKIADVKKFVINFTVARNVTTQTGIRSIYVRITTPTNEVLTKGGTCSYENRQIPYSIKKDIEYTGEEQSVTVYWDVAETLSAGTYRVDIIADGYDLGHTSFSFEK